MGTTIKLKNSVTTTNAPSSLVQGEVAINITDKKVWVGNAATTPVQLLGDGGSGSFTSIAFGAGTVSNPSITFTGDTNTGIYSPAADTIAFTEGGVESMRIDSSGNVGIGTSSPSAFISPTLQINTRTSLSQIFGDLQLSNNAFYDTGWKYQTTAPAANYYQSSGIHVWRYATSGTAGNAITWSEAMRIDSSGNVGIGTSSPTASYKLTLTGGVGLNIQNAGASDNSIVKYSNSGKNWYVGLRGDTSNIWAIADDSAFRLVIDTSGNVGIGTSSPARRLDVRGSLGMQVNEDGVGTKVISIRSDFASSGPAVNVTTNDPLLFLTNNTERMRITSGGDLLVGKTAVTITTAGSELRSTGIGVFTVSGGNPIAVNRLTNDGNLIEFYQDTVLEGTISVSGTTVSYNGGHLARWSQLPNNQKDDTLLKGTVMSNLDDMCVWTKDGEVLPNEQLNKMKVSDVEGDTNVAGVFVNWTFDEQCQSDDMNVAMTGDMIIRIAQGVVVQKGDLLMSAGDGTAKPQGDDIVRSKTVAKVTSNHVTCTYEDGSYCVPCVLMAC